MTMNLEAIIELRERKLTDRQREEDVTLERCEEARRAYLLSRQRVDEFTEEIRTLELDLLNELLDTRITIHDIDALNERLAEAEATAKRLADAVSFAEVELANAEQDVAKARVAKRSASARLKKINCFNDELNRERAILATAAEDAEIDDFVETMFARG